MPFVEVDRAPVVGIDEGEERQLVALVEIRDARHRQLEQCHASGDLRRACRKPFRVRAEFLVDAVSYTRVRGRPLTAGELEEAITAMTEAS